MVIWSKLSFQLNRLKVKDRTESFVYYPVYLVRVVVAATRGYVIGFIRSWRSNA